MSKIEAKLAEMGLVLPAPKEWPSANRTGYVRVSDTLFVSGHGPGGVPDVVTHGKVGAEVSERDAYFTARACALSMLASVREKLGDLDQVKRVVKLLGLVNSAPGFDRQFAVIDGASDLFLALWGDEYGQHARAAFGVAELPRTIPVEIEGIFEVWPAS